MTARLPHNPRVLAAPDDALAGDEASQFLVESAQERGWCIALDGVEAETARELQQAVDPELASVWLYPSGGVVGVRVCIAAGQVDAVLGSLEPRDDAALQVLAAIHGVLAAREREAWTLRCGGRELEVGARTLVMGIVNVTPDSFSDGGEFCDPAAAIEHGMRLAGEGADILDIGGESTRPGAQAVGAEEECERVLPVVEALAAEVGVPVSIDTSKAAVAQRAIEAGAAMINDVTALRSDPEMPRVAAEAGVPVVLMHMLGSPRTMQNDPQYDDLMGEIIAYLRGSMALALDAGVPEDQLVVDPGIGFGKALEHNLEIMRRLPQLRSLGCPILLGTSRKSFIGAVTGAEAAERVFGTAATVALGIARGAHIVRVHDVAAMRQVAQMTDAMLG